VYFIGISLLSFHSENNPDQRVYQIPCSCKKSHIGQTGRSFKARLKEHISDTTHNQISKLVIVEHSFKSKNLICFDQTKILASTSFTLHTSFVKLHKLKNIQIILIMKMATNLAIHGSPPFICSIIKPFLFLDFIQLVFLLTNHRGFVSLLLPSEPYCLSSPSL
jgi:hypothetical protein